MERAALPPGFRFHPTDEELVGYYLKRKVEGLQIELEVIPVIDLYKFDPWELPEKSFLPHRDMEWFFLCPRDKKYPNGSRTNRATKAGYWKATGKDRKVTCHSPEIGYRKTLVFYRGRAPSGDRTDWIMHEYRLSDHQTQEKPNLQGGFVLCRVAKKKEKVKKNNNGGSKTTRLPSSNQKSMESCSSSSIASMQELNPIITQQSSVRIESVFSQSGLSSNFNLGSSKDHAMEQESISDTLKQYEPLIPPIGWQLYEQAGITPLDDLSRSNGYISPHSAHGSLMDFHQASEQTRCSHALFDYHGFKVLF